jgi:hypothetical protein
LQNQLRITCRTKIDPNTRKKMKTGEIGRNGIFELYIQDREQKRKRKQRTRTTFTKIYYTRITTRRTVLKNQMGVRCVAITPIVLTSFSNKGLCNIHIHNQK